MSNFLTDIKDADFNKMKFNIIGVPISHKIVDYFPELQIYPEFNTEEDIFWEYNGVSLVLGRDEMCRFVLFSYDPNSPLLQFPDIAERKKLAYQKATGKAKAPLYIDAVIAGNCPGVNDILKCFFKILNQRTFELWITAIEFFAELNESVRQPIPPGDLSDDKLAVVYKNKNQNMKDAIALNEEILKLEVKLFANNEDLQKIITKTEVVGNKGALELRKNKRMK